MFWLKFATQFYQRTFIQQAMQAITRRHAHMVIALRTNLQVALQLGAVEYLTTVALGPYTLRNARLAVGVMLLLIRSIQLIDNLSA